MNHGRKSTTTNIHATLILPVPMFNETKLFKYLRVLNLIYHSGNYINFLYCKPICLYVLTR